MAVARAYYIGFDGYVQNETVTNPSIEIPSLSMAVAFREDMEFTGEAVDSLVRVLTTRSTLTHSPQAVEIDESLFRPKV